MGLHKLLPMLKVKHSVMLTALNPAARQKRCLEHNGQLVPCKRCTNNPAKKDVKVKQTCQLVCNAPTSGATPCDFYGYLNNNKKKHSRALLAKFGLVILRKFFRR